MNKNNTFIWNRNLLQHYKCLYCHFWSNPILMNSSVYFGFPGAQLVEHEFDSLEPYASKQMHDHVLHLCINLWTPCTASVWGEPLLKKSFSLSTSLMAPHQLKMFHCDDLPKHTKLLVSPMHRAQRIGWGRMHGNKWTSYTQGRLRTHQTCTHTSVFCSMDLSERTNNWTAVFVLNPLCIKCKRCTCWL